MDTGIISEINLTFSGRGFNEYQYFMQMMPLTLALENPVKEVPLTPVSIDPSDAYSPYRNVMFF